jgi:hypothetical protein
MFGAICMLRVSEELLPVPEGLDAVYGDGDPELPSDLN